MVTSKFLIVVLVVALMMMVVVEEILSIVILSEVDMGALTDGSVWLSL